MTENTIKSLMDSFEFNARVLAPNAEWDSKRMIVRSEFGALPTFHEEMEARGLELDDISDSEIGEGGIDIAEDARADMLRTMKANEEIDFDSKDGAASRRTDFSQSTGRSTTRSVNTERYQAQHKERAIENATLKATLANQAAEHEALLARIADLESKAVATDGPPPLVEALHPQPTQEKILRWTVVVRGRVRSALATPLL